MAFSAKFDAGADPSVGTDQNHNVYYSCLAFNANARNKPGLHQLVTGVFVYKGQVKNNALQWSPTPTRIAGNTAIVYTSKSPNSPLRAGTINDRPNLSVDQITGKVYVD